MADFPNRQRVGGGDIPASLLPRTPTLKLPPRIPGIQIARQEGVEAAWVMLIEGNDQQVVEAAARTLVQHAIKIAGDKPSEAAELMGHVSCTAYDRRSDKALYTSVLEIHDAAAHKISCSNTHISIASIGRPRAPMVVKRTPKDERYPNGPATVSWSPL
jgi:hypothetical protein